MNQLKQKIKFYGVKKLPRGVSQKEIKLGIKTELEHTKDRKIARAISLAHLHEFPTYYTKGLIPLERKLKKIGRRTK